MPIYYAYGFERAVGETGWALDLIHHKLYLQNPPPEVRSFSVSHGYNLVTLTRLWDRGRARRGLGAGIVIAHPESAIRGRVFDEHGGLFRRGYYVAGVTTCALLARSMELAPRWSVSVAGRLTLSYARVKVAGGHADVPNLALHATAGLSFRAR